MRKDIVSVVDSEDLIRYRGPAGWGSVRPYDGAYVVFFREEGAPGTLPFDSWNFGRTRLLALLLLARLCRHGLQAVAERYGRQYGIYVPGQKTKLHRLQK